MTTPSSIARREFLRQSAGGVAVAAASSTAAGQAIGPEGAQRPNVLWIFGDQHRAQALSCMGDVNLSTPNIDALAGGAGTTAIAGAPLCTPFRGAMLTSRYPHQCVPGHDYAMPDGMPMVSTAFNEAGYRTAYFGKWHVDGRENRAEGERSGKQFVRPERRGAFETWLGYENNNLQYDCWLHGHDTSGSEVSLFQLQGYETDAITNHLIDYIKERGAERASGNARPFFAAMSVQPPHSPYVAPEEFMARHRPEDIQLRPNVPNVARIVEEARRDLAGYYAMIENLDWNVGRVVRALEESGQLEDTYIVFFSDHGDMHGSQARILKCVPWEESIRIPFIVSKGGQPCVRPVSPTPRDTMINHVDIAPTTLGLCGLPIPGWMHGKDCSGLFIEGRDEPEGLDSAFLQLIDPGYRYGFAVDRERPWRGVVTQDGWKYAVLDGGQPWLLHNLNEDPYELANLAMDGRVKAERRKLQERLADWLKDTGDWFALPTLPQ
ncbi:MAG: sulfatase [Candidatus Hydrogenedentes bacterium]|nr:sulfatase [Candidatus Hydrogenedentota bacterium]